MNVKSMLNGSVGRVYRGLNRRIARFYLHQSRESTHRNLKLEFLGSHKNGRTVPVGILNPKSICYSFGVGRDITFDLEIIERYGCEVHCFDPTPASIAFIAPIEKANPKVLFHPVGVWIEDKVLTFHNPDVATSTNFSVFDLHGTGTGFQAQCKTLKTLMRELNHTQLDLLKIDIEGGWFPVVLDLLKLGLKPKLFLVECDSPNSLLKSRTLVKGMEKLGLHLEHCRKDDLLFVHESVSQG